MNNKELGFVLISVALAISTFANYHCSFMCEGMYGQIINPLSIVGFIFYVLGTIAIFSSENTHKTGVNEI